MRFPEDLSHQMHTIGGRDLPVVFADDSMAKYTCHVKGGNVVDGCGSRDWCTTQIDKHMIEKHQLCCYNHALSKSKINYRCPFGCRCFFQVDQVAGFITKDQCLLHLHKFHQGESAYQSKVAEVKAMLVQTRLKIKETFANRKNKVDHYDELESNYRSSRRELDVALIKLNVFQEFINGCPGDVQEQIRDKIQLELAEYLALNTVSQ
jgi:hypothetical protein